MFTRHYDLKRKEVEELQRNKKNKKKSQIYIMIYIHFKKYILSFSLLYTIYGFIIFPLPPLNAVTMETKDRAKT
jgi:hypothetical protein